MKSLKLLALSLLLFWTACGFAAETLKKPVPSHSTSRLGTSFHMDGSSLHGKFQSSPNTTATVENDKFLEDLLGARSNFDDRIKQDQERN